VRTTSLLAGWRRLVAVAVVLVLAAAACGDDADDGAEGTDDVQVPEEPEGEPTPGGRVVYGLEAETSGGFCLAEAQLAIAGIQVARTIYDTLTTINEDGEYVPFLAEAVEPNDDFTEWTITVRDGIEFHDGTPLNADVVANNLDAFRGTYNDGNEDRPDRHGDGERFSVLFTIVLELVENVDTTDDMTVVVSLTQPWPAFPAFLFSSGRMGMMAQAQLDSDRCNDQDLIGTGPFEFSSWQIDDRLVAERNENYWLQDENGNQLPYLDAIEYRPVTEGAQRVNLLESGEINALHTSSAIQIDRLRGMDDMDTVNMVESDAFAEVAYLLLNSNDAEDADTPFSSKTAREAVTVALDRERLIEVRGLGIPTIADGPFAPGSPGYLEEPGFAAHDPERARELVQQYQDEEGEALDVTISHTPDPENVATAEMIQEMLQEVGIQTRLERIEQAQLINTALGGGYDLLLWRNHPGGDPDTQYVWWRSGYPTNFGRINDPEIDRILDEGRSETDAATREELYQELTQVFAEELYNIWMSYTIWTIASGPDIYGVFGPPLPDGSQPNPGLATGHSVAGMWIEQ
jgi:peptide/nickel transport system substrate-binding protein